MLRPVRGCHGAAVSPHDHAPFSRILTIALFCVPCAHERAEQGLWTERPTEKKYTSEEMHFTGRSVGLEVECAHLSLIHI